MARLDFNLDTEKGGTLVSFYCDAEQAEKLKENKKAKEAAPKQANPVVHAEGDDLEGIDEPSEPTN